MQVGLLMECVCSSQVNIELSELELNTHYRTWLRLQLKDPPAENGKKS